MHIKQFLTATILLLSSAVYGQTNFEKSKLLAGQDDAVSQTDLGFYYVSGIDGVPKNDAEAVK